MMLPAQARPATRTLIPAALALALAILSAGALAKDPDAHGIVMTGVRLRVTEQAETLQDIGAQRAQFAEEDELIRVEGVRLASTRDAASRLEASAPAGRMVISKDRRTREVVGEPGLEEIRTFAGTFEEKSDDGDLMLQGSGLAPATAVVVGVGSLSSEKIIRSRRYEAVLLPGPFRQEGTLKDGTRISIEGAALWVDSAFNSWTYYADGDTQGRLEFRAPAANPDPKTTPPGTSE